MTDIKRRIAKLEQEQAARRPRAIVVLKDGRYTMAGRELTAAELVDLQRVCNVVLLRVVYDEVENVIRVRIEMVPDGVEDMAYEIDRVIVSCKYPLDNHNQNLSVWRGLDAAEISGYNMTACYDPATADRGWIDLAIRGLQELRDNSTRRAGGELIPGIYALTPEAFDATITAMVKDYPEILTIRLFGRRAEQTVTIENFRQAFEAHNKIAGVVDGGYILANHPNYVPYGLEIRLRPEIYQNGRGEQLEGELFKRYGVRDFPHVQSMICSNGLLMFFHRPDGSYSLRTPAGHELVQDGADQAHTFDRRRVTTVGGKINTYEQVKRLCNSGNVIYKRRAAPDRRLFPYPGRKE